MKSDNAERAEGAEEREERAVAIAGVVEVNEHGVMEIEERVTRHWKRGRVRASFVAVERAPGLWCCGFRLLGKIAGVGWPCTIAQNYESLEACVEQMRRVCLSTLRDEFGEEPRLLRGFTAWVNSLAGHGVQGELF